MHINNVKNQSTTYNFNVVNKNKTKNRNWNIFLDDWKNCKYIWEELTEEEKEYIKLHDPCYAQFFV